LAKGDLVLRDPRNPSMNHNSSKIAEKPLNHDYKHYMFQASKQKETQKLQSKPQPARKTPNKP
jgi:hypothetical protein